MRDVLGRLGMRKNQTTLDLNQGRQTSNQPRGSTARRLRYIIGHSSPLLIGRLLQFL